MHSLDMLEYGHQMVLTTLLGLDEFQVNRPDVCGQWSVKDIVAHLASFEAVLLDVLTSLTTDQPTPTLDRWTADAEAFNDAEVARRSRRTFDEVLDEYIALHHAVIDQLIRTPQARLRERGALPWYGDCYDVEDFIAYSFYGHKREHCAEINVFRNHITRMDAIWEAQLAC